MLVLDFTFSASTSPSSVFSTTPPQELRRIFLPSKGCGGVSVVWT